MELTVELDEARELMYETLREELDKEVLRKTIDRSVNQKVTKLYDNRDSLEKRET
jgi:hypothetical protein